MAPGRLRAAALDGVLRLTGAAALSPLRNIFFRKYFCNVTSR
jgi:hypothetical protein